MFCLDTSTVVDFLRKPPAALIARVAEATSAGELSISAVVLFELANGALRHGRPRDQARLNAFLEGGVVVWPFDDDDAWEAARVRSSLEADGRGIGPFDTLIAGQALAKGLVLVTSNTREFSRVSGLRLEDWRA